MLAPLVASLAAPWQLTRLCAKRHTWRTFAKGAEMLVLQCHGGLTVTTPLGGPTKDPEAPVALRSLIQLDGDVLLMISPTWLEQQQEPERLQQALTAHQAQISAALQPLREGFDLGAEILTLAGRSRWPVLGAAGLSQAGAIALAPDLSLHGLFAWLGDPADHLWMLLCQAFSFLLFGVVGAIRLLLRWWIRRRINHRLPRLMQRLTGQELNAARAAA